MGACIGQAATNPPRVMRRRLPPPDTARCDRSAGVTRDAAGRHLGNNHLAGRTRRGRTWQSDRCNCWCWGSANPDFHGEIIEELERLSESDTVRVIDALAVYKDAAG